MAELVDAPGSGPGSRKGVLVRVQFWAPLAPGGPRAPPGRRDGRVNKVRVGFFSFTEVTDPGEHQAYNRWHQLDHIPENLALPGIAHGQRWVRTPACEERHLASAEPALDRAHYVTLYLMTAPVERTLDEFRHLGARLAAIGPSLPPFPPVSPQRSVPVRSGARPPARGGRFRGARLPAPAGNLRLMLRRPRPARVRTL